MQAILKQATLLFILTFCLPATASNYESMDNIKKTAEHFLTSAIQIASDEKMEIAINKANIPFQVTACSSPLSATFPKGGNQNQVTSVDVSCNGSENWHIFVPVEVQILAQVLITKRTLSAREYVTAEDIDFTLADKNRLYNGYFNKKEDVIGNVTTHLVTAGTILNKKNLQLPLLVHKNQTITLVAQSNAVMVSMQGIAKSDGALNDVVKVFNPSSKRILDAIVTGPNKAQVSA